MKKAIYVFSGDPITYGHIDIIQRASGAFDKVIAGIGTNPDKHYMFNLEERVEMAKKALIDIKNVEVISFQGLLVDYAYECGVNVIIKGVRNSADFDYENILHRVGESQKLGIDTHVLFARPELAHVSSSAVKALQKEQGLIHEYVPLHVKQSLETMMSNQYIVGVTGEAAAGKSYLCQKFVELGKDCKFQVHNIELDHIGHQILGDLKELRYEKVRQDIADTFGKEVRNKDGSIDRKCLGEIVFNDSKALSKLNEIMYLPILVRLRRELYGKKGLVLFNSALIAESDMAYLCNNNVVLISTNKETQQKRLADRKLSPEQIERRLASQFNSSEKKQRITEIIERDNQGKLWTLNNSDNLEDDEIKNIFEAVCQELGVSSYE